MTAHPKAKYPHECPSCLAAGEDWHGRYRFRWCLPRFNVTRPADTRPRVVLNRYPHNIIGVAVVAFGRGWGVRWKRS